MLVSSAGTFVSFCCCLLWAGGLALSRLRYRTCLALYNIAKIGTSQLLLVKSPVSMHAYSSVDDCSPDWYGLGEGILQAILLVTVALHIV